MVKQREQDMQKELEKNSTLTMLNRQLESEVGMMREQVSGLEVSENDDKNESIKQEHRKNQAELEIIDAKHQVDLIRKEKQRVEEDNQELRQELEKSKSLVI